MAIDCILSSHLSLALPLCPAFFLFLVLLLLLLLSFLLISCTPAVSHEIIVVVIVFALKPAFHTVSNRQNLLYIHLSIPMRGKLKEALVLLPIAYISSYGEVRSALYKAIWP